MLLPCVLTFLCFAYGRMLEDWKQRFVVRLKLVLFLFGRHCRDHNKVKTRLQLRMSRLLCGTNLLVLDLRDYI